MACEQQSFNQQKVRSQQVQGSEDSPRSSLLTGGEKERGPFPTLNMLGQ